MLAAERALDLLTAEERAEVLEGYADAAPKRRPPQ